MYLRRNTRTKGEISIDEPLNQDGDGNELLLSDILGTEPDITSRRIEDEVDKTLLKTAIMKLNDREKNIMDLSFSDERINTRAIPIKTTYTNIQLRENLIHNPRAR